MKDLKKLTKAQLIEMIQDQCDREHDLHKEVDELREFAIDTSVFAESYDMAFDHIKKLEEELRIEKQCHHELWEFKNKLLAENEKLTHQLEIANAFKILRKAASNGLYDDLSALCDFSIDLRGINALLPEDFNANVTFEPSNSEAS